MSTSLGGLWQRMGRGGQIAGIGMVVAVVGLLLWLLLGLSREQYGVLFGDLTGSDAASIVKQLKKEKIPYRLSEDGTTILVPADKVHDVRLTLMSSDLPLSGGVGFEIFDKQGLGTTEHAQKVSFQRALQGELARTIGAMDHVRQVRVHLVMPESTLFTRDRQQASAAIVVALEPGATLDRSQVVGVQRLVAAAVPGLEASRVVISDHRGVNLTASDADSAGAADGRLQVKRDVEEYMTHKIVRLLDGAFGPGQALVSVDASLNFDATKTTIQDLLPAAGDEAGQGRVVRRRQVTGSSAAQPMWSSATDAVAAPQSHTPSSTSEVEYEYGRRLDEVISAPGAVTRLSVGVIVPGEFDEEKRSRIADLVRMAVGIDTARGDAISVQPLSQLVTEPAPAEDADAKPVQVEAAASPVSPAPTLHPSSRDRLELLLAALVAVVMVIGLLLLSRRRRELSPQERQQLLDELRVALSNDDAAMGRPRS